MKSIVVIIIALFTNVLCSQTVIEGVVIDQGKDPIAGANVYLKGTYAGSMTDEKGRFEFLTQKKGTQILVVSYVSFETKEIVLQVSIMKSVVVKLK
jgi:hypothetical protein